MSDKMPDRFAGEVAWNMKEFDWTGKSFYFVTFINLLGIPIGFNSKLEQLNRGINQAGHKRINNMILIQFGVFKARAMIEIETPEFADSQVTTFDEPVIADTMIAPGSPAKVSAHLATRVASKRNMEPRQVYYVYDSSGKSKTIVIALT
ncbi:MAG: hypothetical protein P9M15_06995 [Candidatus Electryoneaceae bacterium]|nr:hypothetical protein [Candidatus Electryoneaceae bacterium]